MAFTTQEQIIGYIKDSHMVVLALNRNITPDILGSASALSHLLTHFQKPHQIIIEAHPKNFEFLTSSLTLIENFKQARRLVITLDIHEQGLEKFYYTTDPEKQTLEIYVVPKTGFFNPDHVRIGQGGFEYDLIITLGAPDVRALGKVYHENTAFFHETPIINIDNQASNEKFGEINLIEPTKSSLSEIVFDVLENDFRDIVTKPVATGLFAGILDKTQSFKVSTLTPHTLEKASKLMALGADRESIVRELFYNKSLPLVKLWGRVLARLKEDKEHRLYWSLINTDDYVRAQADPDIIDKVFEEVLHYLPQDATVVLFSEFNGSVMIFASSGDPHIQFNDLFSSYKITETKNGISFKI